MTEGRGEDSNPGLLQSNRFISSICAFFSQMIRQSKSSSSGSCLMVGTSNWGSAVTTSFSIKESDENPRLKSAGENGENTRLKSLSLSSFVTRISCFPFSYLTREGSSPDTKHFLYLQGIQLDLSVGVMEHTPCDLQVLSMPRHTNLRKKDLQDKQHKPP